MMVVVYVRGGATGGHFFLNPGRNVMIIYPWRRQVRSMVREMIVLGRIFRSQRVNYLPMETVDMAYGKRKVFFWDDFMRVKE